MISVRDIDWLSGYLEGEGCFSTYTTRVKKYRTFSIHVYSTDRDMVERASALLREDHSKEVSRRTYFSSKFGHQPQFACVVVGSRAISWMMTLYPLMGIRRRQKIKEIIDIWKAYDYRSSKKVG